ncbi:galactosyltransferase-related protein [Mycolicibacterium sphagni]|uniref:Galactosyltransferase C-terminal domain-containing protein n=1 Tax=Mycolicibacterium sphagni TaxID=1786 RepID=A0A255DT70_9MYCO|nr:galactosyltransferase-related protein [Mycolicibacterium sphagni]OYN80435.1 hypothetical protein CG716_09940 [Mycolicibacterium sphagni]
MIPVLVPYRPDHGHRDELWAFVQRAFWNRLPYTVVEGAHDDGPFNRSAAVNRAANDAGDWDVAIIADADTWVAPTNLAKAVDQAAAGLVSALTSVVELGEACTRTILAGNIIDPTTFGIDRIRTDDIATQSSMLVVSRELWDHVGGFDEKFVGWGGEDNAFWKAATILGGPPRRVDGCAFHLWHEPASDQATRMRDPGYVRNLNRWLKYQRARNASQLRAAQHA